MQRQCGRAVLYTRFAETIGTYVSETTMRPRRAAHPGVEATGEVAVELRVVAVDRGQQHVA